MAHMWHIVCSTFRTMVAFPRSSKTLIFVRPRAEDVDDTVTQILPPGKKRSPRPAPNTHRPPKARTSAEGELPSIMVTQDSWVPPTPTRVMRRMDATVVRRPRPARASEAPAGMKEVSARRYNLTLAFVALGIGLLCLYLAPLLSRLMETAFVALNR